MTGYPLHWTERRCTEDAICKIGQYRGLEVLLVSSQPSIDIINTPECVGRHFQEKMSLALGNIAQLLLGERIGNALASSPCDVIYVLRGGLNFNLHQVLASATGRNPEVSFLSSQRIEKGDGFEIAESEYSKWSIQDCAVLCIGDICATGTTVSHAISAAVAQYCREGKVPQWLLIVSIGTGHLLEVISERAEQLKKLWGPTFKGITVVYLEGIFTLYRNDPLLARSHLPNTDFLRKDAPRSLNLELDTLRSPYALLERCAIYDGGSRSFEPRTYLGNLTRYWQKLRDSYEGVSLHELLAVKSDALNYRLPYGQWKARTPWWGDEPDEAAVQKVYEMGQVALDELQTMTLQQCCEQRLKQIASRTAQLKGDAGYEGN